MINIEILMQAVMESRDGITISDARLPDYPLVFANPAFEKLTGYTQDEIINNNCRYLQANDKQQRDTSKIRKAIQQGEYCLVTLRNYRKDGTMFWNELSISPVYNAQAELTHFIGIQKDVTARVTLEQHLLQERKLLEQTKAKLEQLIIHDGLTGIYSRSYFEDQLSIFWKHAVESQNSLVVMFIDVDYFKLFNDSYGHIAGDEALKTVASCLHDSMRRNNDFVARYGGEEFIVLAADMDKEQAIAHADLLCQNIRNLNIPHASSPHHFLTISCGIAYIKPNAESTSKVFLHCADQALYQAKAKGRNKVVLYKD
ncbi:GGDEF domain-containing protein [Methyloradius palustris]|uniref:Diguanylate cyclase n=1 Tax=Methyloradius palustris TaxID=2778876 RepID=A0A8D5G3H0_9PROT|nr:GGDEF domain-containing protein [Methyloradius palustris]BCM25328.1 hypothetical protein ZMTM_15870 [Methyloradius palustris]